MKFRTSRKLKNIILTCLSIIFAIQTIFKLFVQFSEKILASVGMKIFLQIFLVTWLIYIYIISNLFGKRRSKLTCDDQYYYYCCFLKSKKVSNDQELIQSDPISCPQNQKGNN